MKGKNPIRWPLIAKIILSVGILTCEWCSTGRADLITGLNAYWQFEENGTDSSSFNRDLTFHGSPGFEVGLFGSALQLSGIQTQFATQSDSVFDFGASNFTVQLWINFSSLSGEQTLFEKFTGGSGPGYTITKLSNNRFQLFANGAGSMTSSSGTSGSSWDHLVVRRDGSAFEMFLNGASVATMTSANAITNSPNPLLIGERQGGQDFPLDGRLDEIAVWSRALDNSEVSTLYNGGNGLQISSVPEPSSLLFVLTAALIAWRTTWRNRSVTSHH